MEVARELWERELGRAALAAVEGLHGAGGIETLAEKDAVRLLEGIRDILDDESLSDFDCVEGIVGVLERAGVSTSRHDFG